MELTPERYTKNSKKQTRNEDKELREDNYLRKKTAEHLAECEKKFKVVPFEPASDYTLDVIESNLLSIQFDEKKGPHSTKYKDEQYREQILLLDIRDLSSLESNRDIGPTHGTRTGHLAYELTRKKPRFVLTGPLGEEFYGTLLPQWKREAKALRNLQLATARARSGRPSTKLLGADDLLAQAMEMMVMAPTPDERKDLEESKVIFKLKIKEATTKRGLVYAHADRINPDKIKLGCTSFADLRFQTYKTSTGFPAYMTTKMVDNKWDLEREFLKTFEKCNIRNLDFNGHLPTLEPEWKTEKQGGTELFYMPIGSPQRARLLEIFAALAPASTN